VKIQNVLHVVIIRKYILTIWSEHKYIVVF
jgi:hypothetical protein